MNTNQIVLLHILQTCPNNHFVGSIKLIKTIFLIQERLPELLTYNWKRWDYGPFDNQIYKDLDSLEAQNLIKTSYIKDKKNYILSKKFLNNSITIEQEFAIKEIINMVNKHSTESLLQYIYKKYSIFDYEMGDQISIN